MKSSLQYYLIVLFTICVSQLYAQEVIQYREDKSGLLKVTDKLSIPYEQAGYTLVLPQTRPIKGLVVFFNSDRDTLNKLHRFAIPKGFAVSYITTGNSIDFLFETASLNQLEAYLHQIISQYQIPRQKLLFLGMSLAGTRAVKFSLFSTTEESKYQYVPKAIAICDAPLDFVRFWNACYQAKNLKFNKIAANEGDWVTQYLQKNLGGTPTDVLDNYLDYSPFSFTKIDQQKLVALSNISIRVYHEPDVNWWIDTRRKDYYGMNSVDLAAWVNALKISGHENVSLIGTKNKGYLPDGRRHPHSWSIVNEKELMHWFTVICNNN